MSHSFNPHNNPRRQVLWSLLTDMATRAQRRARNPLGSHRKWGKQNLKMVPKAPATKLLSLHGAVSQSKMRAASVLTQIYRRSLRTSLVHDWDWTPIHLFPSSLASPTQSLFLSLPNCIYHPCSAAMNIQAWERDKLSIKLAKQQIDSTPQSTEGRTPSKLMPAEQTPRLGKRNLWALFCIPWGPGGADSSHLSETCKGCKRSWYNTGFLLIQLLSWKRMPALTSTHTLWAASSSTTLGQYLDNCQPWESNCLVWKYTLTPWWDYVSLPSLEPETFFQLYK